MTASGATPRCAAKYPNLRNAAAASQSAWHNTRRTIFGSVSMPTADRQSPIFPILDLLDIVPGQISTGCEILGRTPAARVRDHLWARPCDALLATRWSEIRGRDASCSRSP